MQAALFIDLGHIFKETDSLKKKLNKRVVIVPPSGLDSSRHAFSLFIFLYNVYNFTVYKYSLQIQVHIIAIVITVGQTHHSQASKITDIKFRLYPITATVDGCCVSAVCFYCFYYYN